MTFPCTSVIASTISSRRRRRSTLRTVRATSSPQAEAGIGQDPDDRLVRRTGLGERLHLVVGEEPLRFGDDAGEGYVFGDVPDSRPSRTAAARACDSTRWA